MANLTTNVDVDYIQRDYNSIVDATITFATINFGPGTSANRLWTNFNADSFSRNWLEILAFIGDALFFYFDNQATQTYLQTATVRSAIRNIAKQFGFTPASATSASGVVQFTVNGAGTIPRGFRVRASNGATYFTTQAAVAVAPGTISVPVLQGEIVTETFVAAGLQNEEFLLRGPNVIVDQNNLNPLDITPQVTIGGNSYSLVDSLIRHNGTDTPAVVDSLGNIVGGGGRVFLLDEKPDGTPFLRFGDGIFGRKLQPGDIVTVTYRTGGGSFGNIAEEAITTLVDSNAIVVGVSNEAEFSGGADEQNIEQLRELIPASLRTLDRAVAEQDYSDILVANFSEVFTASTEPNNTDPGIDLNIYVVPQGVGIPKITDNLILRNRLSKYIDRRKMVTVQFQILDAFGVDSLLTLEVFISDTASKSTVSESLKTAILNFFSLTTGGASGSGVGFAEPILIKDICNIVEAIPGVVRFEIKRLTYRPRVEKNIVGIITDYNISDVTVYKNVQEREWLLAAQGPVSEPSGTVIFNNPSSIGFSYNSSTGEITYSFPVDLSGVAPGDQFRGGPGVAEVTEITTVADVSNSLNNTYFLIDSPSTQYYVWYNVSGNGTDPAIPLKTGIQVTISTNDSANDVATATANAIDLLSDFSSTSSANVVTVTNANIGSVNNAVDGAVPTTFTFNVTTEGIDDFVDYTILAVDTVNSIVTIPEGQIVNLIPGVGAGGSIRNGNTSYESYKVFKKILAKATNLSTDTITDSDLDLSVLTGSGVAISSRVMLDNFNVFKSGEYSTGNFYLVDAASNVWEILANDSNTLSVSVTAVNDASVTSLTSGDYSIVEKLTGNQITFSGNIFNIQYNTQNTFFSSSAQFSQIGTIGDKFTISIQQTNIGRLGVALDLIAFDSTTGIIRLNSSPDLKGISTDDVVIDSDGQIFNVVGVDNLSKPSTNYTQSNFDTQYILQDSGVGSQISMGFKVPVTDIYAVVSFYLKREGNIVGNLTAKIVNDDGTGLPNLSSPIATSQPLDVTKVSDTGFNKIFFSFSVPPTLTASTQYHLVLSGDAGYAGSEQSNVVSFTNSGLVPFTYNVVTGLVQYSGSVNLASVLPGHFWKDSSGNLYKILSVSDDDDTITISDGLSSVDDSSPSIVDDGSVVVNDRVLVGLDTSSPSYSNGEMSEFDGALWSNSSIGPNAGNLGTVSAPTPFAQGDVIFSVEGTKSITIDSNLTPTLGPKATVSRRYYDDQNEISLVVGISSGSATQAPDVNALAIGTVASVPNRPVDNFVFRTSRFADDIVNLRLNEIPQIKDSDIVIQVFGGVD